MSPGGSIGASPGPMGMGMMSVRERAGEYLICQRCRLSVRKLSVERVSANLSVLKVTKLGGYHTRKLPFKLPY